MRSWTVTSLAACAAATAGTVAAAGCGRTQERDSARFSERGANVAMTGAFNWSKRRGWIDQTRGPDGTRYLVQIGDDCYERWGAEWKKSQAEPTQYGFPGICDGIPLGPAGDVKLIRRLGRLDEVGTEQVRGVETTHYRTQLRIGALKSKFDLWIDDRDLARRVRQRALDGSFTETLDYFDLGAGVDVEAPRGPFLEAAP